MSNSDTQPLSTASEDKRQFLSHTLGWDTERFWANSVQVFLAPEQALFILREQMGIRETEDADPKQYVKNVTSFILPLEVAAQFRDVLNSLDFESVKHAK